MQSQITNISQVGFIYFIKNCTVNALSHLCNMRQQHIVKIQIILRDFSLPPRCSCIFTLLDVTHHRLIVGCQRFQTNVVLKRRLPTTYAALTAQENKNLKLLQFQTSQYYAFIFMEQKLAVCLCKTHNIVSSKSIFKSTYLILRGVHIPAEQLLKLLCVGMHITCELLTGSS